MHPSIMNVDDYSSFNGKFRYTNVRYNTQANPLVSQCQNLVDDICDVPNFSFFLRFLQVAPTAITCTFFFREDSLMHQSLHIPLQHLMANPLTQWKAISDLSHFLCTQLYPLWSAHNTSTNCGLLSAPLFFTLSNIQRTRHANHHSSSIFSGISLAGGSKSESIIITL